MKKKMLRALTFLFAAVLAASAGFIALTALDHQRGARSYAAAAETAGLSKRQLSSPPTLEQIAPDTPQEAYEALSALDLGALQEVNPDIIAWIAIPDTELSYPLLQGADNTYYLNRLWNRQRGASGSIYLECECARDFSDFNTIIYGHRMRDTSMFGTLPLYRDQDFFQAHPTVYLSDGAGVRLYDIFAAYEVGVREIVYRLDIDQPEEKEELLRFSLSQSVIQTGVTPGAEDRILTLSTCTEWGHSARWVVQAVLREEEQT